MCHHFFYFEDYDKNTNTTEIIIFPGHVYDETIAIKSIKLHIERYRK